METTQIFRILILCAAALAVLADTSIRLESAQTEVQPGGTLTFSCIAKDLVGGTSFLKIQKKTTPADESPIQISTNAILSSNLAPIGRYTIAYKAGENTNELEFIFTATDVIYEDAGLYGCMIMGGAGVIVEDQQFINVINVVDFVVEIALTRADGSQQTWSNLDTDTPSYELDAHEEFSIVIITSHTNPAPVLQMLVGTQDITDQFQLTDDVTYFPDSTTLLTGVKYSVEAMARLNIGHSYKDGFRVIAKAADHEAVVGFNVKFSGYPPAIIGECTKNIMAGNHEKNVNFECKISSAEPVDVYITYNRDLEDGKFELEKVFPGDLDAGADYHYKLQLVENRDAEEYHVALHMPHMYPQMFNTYTLVASNTKGNLTHVFTVELDASRSPEKPASIASHLSVAIATIVLLCLAAML